MADYQRVVEYIRDVRIALPQQVTDDLRQAAAEYAELCTRANDRLRQCTGFLQQGLRSEAIHLAEEPPNLLDLVAALDLPDADVWTEFCTNTGLPIPPALQMDRAAQVNDAYASEQPMEHLLNRHRLLALSRGPVSERLDVIRQLAAQDSGGGFWEKDIRVFERARLKELPPAFHTALKRRDFDAIGTIAAEIQNTPWLEPVPDDLRAAVGDAYQRMHRAKIEATLAELVPPLHAAFAAKSHSECTALLTRWHDTLKAAGLESVSAELASEVEPIVEWIRQENEAAAKQRAFAAACANFTQLLNNDAANQELEVAYAGLQAADQPIPELLTQRYHERVGQRLAAARGRFKLRLAVTGGVVFGLLLLAVALTLLLQHNSAAQRYADRINQETGHHDADSLRRAMALIQEQEKQSPDLSSEALTRAKDKARQLQEEFDRNHKDLADFTARFTPLKTRAKTLVDSPNATVDELLATAGAIDDAFTHAGDTSKIEWADTDDHAFSTLRDSLANLRAAARARAATLVKSLTDSLAQQVDAIPAASGSDGLAQLAAVSGKVAAFRDMPGLDDATKAAVVALLAKVDQRRDAVQQAQGQLTDLQAIAQRVSSADDLKKALEAYVAKYPNAPISAEFSKALETMPAARAVELWHELVAGWSGKFAPGSAALAAKRIEAIQAYLAANPSSPLAPTATLYATYLKQAADALGDKGTWQNALGDMLANQLLTQLAYMQDSSGTRYYVLGDIKRHEGRLNDNVTVTFEALDPVNPAKRRIVTIAPPLKLVTDTPVPLPHTKLANDLADGLRTLDDSNWDTWQFPFIDRLLKNDQIDPVVRGILLSQMLQTTGQVDGWALGDVYDRSIRDLGHLELDNVVWYDPAHPVADRLKDSLAKVVAVVPQTAEVRQKYVAARDSLFKAAGFDYSGVGVMLKDEKGAWLLPAAPSGSGMIAWAVGPVATTPPPIAPLIPVAIVKDGKFVVNDDLAHDLPQGTLIFIGK